MFARLFPVPVMLALAGATGCQHASLTERLFSPLTTRLDMVNAQLGETNRQLVEVNRQLGGVNQRLDQTNASLVEVVARLGETNGPAAATSRNRLGGTNATSPWPGCGRT